MNNYGINDIQSLSFREGVRERIQMYLGSNDMQGVYAGIQEIISNAIDEFYMGYGKKITIKLKGNEISIEDRGRGIPFGVKEDGSNVLIDIFSKSHTGGKFNQKVYNSVAGLNGIGAKATCLSSKHFTAASFRDGKVATVRFEEGVCVDYSEKDQVGPGNLTGTMITFEPDPKVFSLEPINISLDKIVQMCKNLSYLTEGLEFEISDKEQTIRFCAKDGIADLLKDSKYKPLHNSIARGHYEEGETKVEVALQWQDGPESWFVFTNGIRQIEGGTSLTGMKTAITRFVKAQLGKEFNGDLARNGLCYVVSAKVPNPSFANQTKTKINNPELNGFAQKATAAALKEFAEKYPNDLKKVFSILTKVQKAEVAAEKAKNAILNGNKEIERNIKTKGFASDKLKDARKLGQDSILLICEGDSALNSLAQGRDPNKYGLLGIRGKIINCLSNPIEKVMENEEVKLILSALGVTVNGYRSARLRYGKVGIATDADKDGNHIALLLLSLFSELLPQMLTEGRIFRLEAPTHIVNGNKGSYYYYGENDFKANRVNGEVVLCKGLGEMSPDQMKAAMFGDNQRLIKFNWDNESDELLRSLMGEDVEPRREFLFNKVDFSKIME